MKTLVLGSFSGANYGDTLVLEAIVRTLRQETRGEMTFVVPTPQPGIVAPLGGAEAVDISMRRVLTYRFSGPAVLRAVKECQAVVTTAGILFDRSLLDPRVNFVTSALPVMLTARRRGAVVYGLNVGVTPPTSRVGRVALAAALRAHDAISTRDGDSARLVTGLAPGTAVRERADMAHALLRMEAPAPDPGGAGPVGLNLAAYITSYDPERGVQVTLSDREAVVTGAAARIEELREATGRPVALIATAKVDHRFHLEVAARVTGEVPMVELYALPHEGAMEAMKECSLLIGSRLHACIVGTSLGVPTLALSYEPKVSSYMSEIGCDRWTRPFEDILSAELVETVLDLLSVGEEVAAQARSATNMRGEWALEGARGLVDHLLVQHG